MDLHGYVWIFMDIYGYLCMIRNSCVADESLMNIPHALAFGGARMCFHARTCARDRYRAKCNDDVLRIRVTSSAQM